MNYNEEFVLAIKKLNGLRTCQKKSHLLIYH